MFEADTRPISHDMLYSRDRRVDDQHRDFTHMYVYCRQGLDPLGLAVDLTHETFSGRGDVKFIYEGKGNELVLPREEIIAQCWEMPEEEEFLEWLDGQYEQLDPPRESSGTHTVAA